MDTAHTYKFHTWKDTAAKGSLEVYVHSIENSSQKKKE